MLTISLEELCRYTAATPTTRNMREGQEIINSDLLIMCGVTGRTAANRQFYALCLQTSGITSDPHVVTGNLTIESSVYFKNNDVFVKKMNCSCIAGSSHCCKHIVAVLLFCNRYVLYMFLKWKIIVDRTCIEPLMNIRYMYKLALGSRNNENSVLTFFQTFRLRLESSSVRIYFYKKNTKEES